ncbi:hypothetical protein [Alkalihalobacillus pseudalcaliphilus]|uniref:hypothetical protein n=1 Tax=Alkalihalobacillus pseudalcaliphilus TaxID=79884 RepID=UPI00064DE577|nr:hypothetical protein [Alkalihalobacillus pseudalcaliphilus]KMK76503.1 hypothetical protein AB990_15080 [Alkalihalobacillus pseudalcaliphilus]
MSYQISVLEVPTHGTSLKCVHSALKQQVTKFGEVISVHAIEDVQSQQPWDKLNKANLVMFVFEAKEQPYKQMKAFLQKIDETLFKNKMILPVIIGGTSAHVSIIEYSLKPLLANWKATSLIPTIYLMEESESYRYYCERKESKQEIELYIFEVLKKHIPITYYI